MDTARSALEEEHPLGLQSHHVRACSPQKRQVEAQSGPISNGGAVTLEARLSGCSGLDLLYFSPPAEGWSELCTQSRACTTRALPPTGMWEAALGQSRAG